MDFEWDETKALENLRKHRVAFEEAITVFSDGRSITIPDPVHSVGEFRYVILGTSTNRRLLVVSHTDRGENIRIISAPLANRNERRTYEKDED